MDVIKLKEVLAILQGLGINDVASVEREGTRLLGGYIERQSLFVFDESGIFADTLPFRIQDVKAANQKLKLVSDEAIIEPVEREQALSALEITDGRTNMVITLHNPDSLRLPKRFQSLDVETEIKLDSETTKSVISAIAAFKPDVIFLESGEISFSDNYGQSYKQQIAVADHPKFVYHVDTILPLLKEGMAVDGEVTLGLVNNGLIVSHVGGIRVILVQGM